MLLLEAGLIDQLEDLVLREGEAHADEILCQVVHADVPKPGLIPAREELLGEDDVLVLLDLIDSMVPARNVELLEVLKGDVLRLAYAQQACHLLERLLLRHLVQLRQEHGLNLLAVDFLLLLHKQVAFFVQHIAL